MVNFDKKYEVKSFWKRLMPALIVYLSILLLFLIFLSSSISSGYIIIILVAFGYFIGQAAYDEKFFLVSVISDKTGIKFDYYEYWVLKSIQVDWPSFTYEIAYPFGKNGDLRPYLKFKNNGDEIGDFYLRPKESLFELSYLLTKAKHDSYL